MLRMQNQHFGHFFRLDRRMILPVIGLICADGSEHRHPLMIVRGAPSEEFVEQILVLHVHETRRHFRAFERPADAQKLPAFVVRQRRVGDAVKAVRAKFDFVAEAVRAGGDLILRIEIAITVIVEPLMSSHISREMRSRMVRAFSRALEMHWTIELGLSCAEGKKLEYVFGVRFS